jgi:hypothetical protein
MNLQDFNNTMTVKIVHFDDSTSNVSVNFQVKCISNGRVSLHTTTVDTTQLSEGYTTTDVLTTAWNNIKATVNTWASFNVTEERLTVVSITSTSDAIDLTTFNTNFTVKVLCFQLIPNINPTNWGIQFSVSRTSNPLISATFEGLVPLTQEYCNNTLCLNIAASAWESVKNQACTWAVNNMPTDSVVDTIFTPTSI